jgi:hypothetical protein
LNVATARAENCPLWIAVNLQDQRLVELLVLNGADVDLYKPLRLCIKEGSEAMSRFLIQNGAEILGHDTDDECLLFSALARKDTKLLQLLLQYGADEEIHTPNKQGQLPLLVSLIQDDMDSCKMLIEYGARAKMTIELIEALAERSDVWAEMIFQTVNKPLLPSNSLAAPIEKNNVTLARLLLDNRARINDTDQYGYTPLCLALVCHRDHNDDMLDLLLSRGADVNQECHGAILSHHSGRKMPSKAFVYDDHYDFFEARAQTGVKTYCQDCWTSQFPKATEDGKIRGRKTRGLRPIHLAARMKCRAGPLSKIVAAGARVDQSFSFEPKTNWGHAMSLGTVDITALHIASLPEQVSVLLNASAPVDFTDDFLSFARSPLNWALFFMQETKVQLLLEAIPMSDKPRHRYNVLQYWYLFLQQDCTGSNRDETYLNSAFSIFKQLVSAGFNGYAVAPGRESDRDLSIIDVTRFVFLRKCLLWATFGIELEIGRPVDYLCIFFMCVLLMTLLYYWYWRSVITIGVIWWIGAIWLPWLFDPFKITWS